MQALSFVDCSSHNIFRFKIFKAVHDKAAYFGLATEIIMCVLSLITVAHRGHAANRIIAVTSFKLQKLYYYCSN